MNNIKNYIKCANNTLVSSTVQITTLQDSIVLQLNLKTCCILNVIKNLFSVIKLDKNGMIFNQEKEKHILF